MVVEALPNFRILHLSDLHFGSRSFYSKSEQPAKQLADDIEACLEQHEMRDASRERNGFYQFDCLVISGDLTCFGQKNGMETAKAFLRDIQNAGRWWSPSEYLLLPGNHDIEFGEPPGGAGLVRIPRRKEEREKLYRDTYYEMFGQPLENRWMGRILFDSITRTAIFGFDSCRVEDWRYPGLGFVGFDQIASFAEKLHSECEAASAEPWRRIAFLHHHVLIMGSPDAATAFRLVSGERPTHTIDAAEVQNALEEYKLDFAFHGHFHVPNLRLEANSAAHFGRVISAGSVGMRGSDCDRLHHFLIYEIAEAREPQREDPKLIIDNFQRALSDSGPEQWVHQPVTFPLCQRAPYANGDEAKQVRKLRTDRAEQFWWAYESYPLADACLGQHGRGDFQGWGELELVKRLTGLAKYSKNQRFPDLWSKPEPLLNYMQQNRTVLLEEFKSRLENAREAISFEHFMLEKIEADPRFRAS